MGQRNHTVRRHLTRYALRWWPVYASCDDVPLGFIGEMSGTRVNIVVMDVNTWTSKTSLRID
ncbi:hypothetical protein ACLK19_26530 [Escherichia coli]